MFVLCLFRQKSWENCKILSFLLWLYNATKTGKDFSTREQLSVTIRVFQSFYPTVLFFNMHNHAHYGTYYTEVLTSMEELCPGNKEILSISGTSVQPQGRYPTRAATDMQDEQTINRDAQTPGGITNFSTKQTSLYKSCLNRYSICNAHVTFQGIIITEIILAETIFLEVA